MQELKIKVREGEVHVDVHVTPRASRSAVTGIHDGRLKVQLDAPPVDGAANQALIALFAKLLKVRKRDVVLVRGEASRLKTLAITGTSEDALRALLSA
jgi:uncharacterized protein (TIGR00251 family)